MWVNPNLHPMGLFLTFDNLRLDSLSQNLLESKMMGKAGFKTQR